MKINEVITNVNKTQLNEAAKGREFNHLEDLMLFAGSEGAMRSADILASLQTSERDLSIKWDGKLALYYGRLPDGTFALGTIGNWRKNDPKTSAHDINQYIVTNGKGEEWRSSMGQALAESFDMLEASVPTSFRGFVKGDVIFAPVMAPVERDNNSLNFTSNKVRYEVDLKSDIGRKIAVATVGIALHMVYENWGDDTSRFINANLINQFNTRDVLALGQTYAQISPDVDYNRLAAVRAIISQHQSLIDSVLPGTPGLADMGAILYKYQNQTSRAGQLGNIGWEHFDNWLNGSNVSKGKQARIRDINAESPATFDVIFKVIDGIRAIKNDIIEQLDNANTDIKTFTGGQAGGEGYMSLKSKTKLVPRHIWRPA